MNKQYLDLIYSERVLPATRNVLLQRMSQGAKEEAIHLSPDLYQVLAAALHRLIPQDDRVAPIDIAERLSRQHSKGKGDGWRYADMPPDEEAFALGLTLLEQESRRRFQMAFAELSGDRQDLLLNEVQKGQVQWTLLNARRWFEELLADATAIFASHPDTLSEIGFSGIAFLPLWERVGLAEEAEWEPKPRE